MSGFGFDVTTGAATALDEVWDMEVKKDPTIHEFRDKPIANAVELSEILEGTQATGHRAIYPGIPRSVSTDLEGQTDDDSLVPHLESTDADSHQSKKRKAMIGNQSNH